MSLAQMLSAILQRRPRLLWVDFSTIQEDPVIPEMIKKKLGNQIRRPGSHTAPGF